MEWSRELRQQPRPRDTEELEVPTMPFQYICPNCQRVFISKCGPNNKRKRSCCSRTCLYAWKTSSIEVNFWKFVLKTDTCWLWTGGMTGRYGGFQYSVNGQRRSEYAHRFAWKLMNGPIPNGLHVLHDCPDGDNPICVRHLWLGTHADNMHDKEKKGRANHPSKVKAEHVNSIRTALADGVQVSVLAERFGVNTGPIYRIKNRNSWKHIPWPDDEW